MAINSILNLGSVEFRNIPNGVDDQLFKVEEKCKVRKELGYNKEDKIILFVGNVAHNNPTKGFENLLKLLGFLEQFPLSGE